MDLFYDEGGSLCLAYNDKVYDIDEHFWECEDCGGESLHYEFNIPILNFYSEMYYSFDFEDDKDRLLDEIREHLTNPT